MDLAVSVVMSVYNGEQYLNEAIDSILGQTLKNFEFIIVDDGSTDSSKEIIKAYNDSRIVLLEQNNTGLAIALNNGIRLTRANYIARMDADDIAMPERLQMQVDFLDAQPDYILIGTNAQVIDRNGDFVYNSKLPLNWEDIKNRFPFSAFFHSSVMFRKDTFVKAGGYYEETSKLYSFEDSILWNKMKEFGKMSNLEHQLIKYRLIPTAATAKSGKEAKLANGILREIVIENNLSEKNIKLLLKINRNINKKERERNYYIHIAKKFLWNNYFPSKSRANLKKAIKTGPFYLYPYCLYLLTFLPKELVLRIMKLRRH